MFFIAEKNLVDIFEVGGNEGGNNDDGYKMVVDGKFKLPTVFSFF